MTTHQGTDFLTDSELKHQSCKRGRECKPGESGWIGESSEGGEGHDERKQSGQDLRGGIGVIRRIVSSAER